MSHMTDIMPSIHKNVPINGHMRFVLQSFDWGLKDMKSEEKTNAACLTSLFTVECIYSIVFLLFLVLSQPKIDWKAGVLLDSSRLFMAIWDKWYIQPCELNCYQVLSLSSIQITTVGFITQYPVYQGNKYHFKIYPHFCQFFFCTMSWLRTEIPRCYGIT